MQQGFYFTNHTKAVMSKTLRVLLILSEREPRETSQHPDTAMVWELTLTMKTGYVEHQRGAQEALLL